MPSKRKRQSTLDKFYEHSTIPKPSNVEDISYIPNLSDIPNLKNEPNEDIDEDLVDDIEMFSN